MLQGEASSTDPTELVQLVLQPLEDALASRHAAILNLDASDFKTLQAIGEGKATPGDIESVVVDRLWDLWHQGRIYYDGSTLIVKYLDMVHNSLSRIVDS
ncbi:hypothetical protein CERSUDRAFT_93828 [Gelatoporia subvermispora B]|uniref:Uncharacterized protein n=1 Tax=Ceriporiopsis subvermispora (strain B) TaxID=914234 RepID=M2RIJ7_CERS8|nr:hypothetical protein CERSUDRAFT_93828 [Gelatoporia subvermispora B]